MTTAKARVASGWEDRGSESACRPRSPRCRHQPPSQRQMCTPLRPAASHYQDPLFAHASPLPSNHSIEICLASRPLKIPLTATLSKSYFPVHFFFLRLPSVKRSGGETSGTNSAT
ncbi:hypothetical protein MPH_03829 [Macrophomina phaseolina MS6]|uniref:Uncharacterized protein n=1 Tax=Macrophomina phaseolina (strain MS6) TaxID=1126212 RepID=K2RVI8_MACPH|nr:hypothetical protein MPH_03829 [Macrophomina phaseolina MS6]